MKSAKKLLNPKTARIAAALLIVGLGLYFAFYNYAKDVARPFDRALVAGGAVKKCERTGSGYFGIDYSNPGYGAYYETSLTRDESAHLITEVASQNGFKLRHAKSGDLPIPDMYIDNYYYDHSSKQNQFWRLKNGPTELTLEVINSGELELSNLGCGTKDIVKVRNDVDHTAIHLNVKLPEVR